MITSNDILTAVRDTPDVTAKQLSERFGVSHATIGSRLLYMVGQGRITREVERKGLTGAPVYKYRFVSFETESDRKAQSVVKRKTTQNYAKPADLESALEVVSKSIADVIMAQVQQQLATAIQGLAQPAVSQPAALDVGAIVKQLTAQVEQPAPKARKPRIVVAGLLPHQVGSLVERVGDAVEIDYWSGPNQLGQLKAKCDYADLVFSHTTHISHKAEDVIKSSRAPLVRVNGGLSQMVEAITKWYCEREVA